MAFTFPEPNVIDPASVTSYRWGVMGAAGIANAFVEGVQKHTTQQIVAVASRTPGKAIAFAEKWGIEALDSYEELLSREDIDIIYVPTLPNQHKQHALMAIAAGKHVLIEKPLTLVPSEAAEIFAAAKAKGVLAMEAMWMRYQPQYNILSQLLANQTLGEIEIVNVSMAQANLGVARLWEKGHGDPFFDMGIYPITLLQTILGKPVKITAQGVLNKDSIDEEVSVQLTYANGGRAYVLVSCRSGLPAIAQISGTKGKLDIGPEFFMPTKFEWRGPEFNAPVAVWQPDPNVVAHEGLSYQATAMASYIDLGLLESPLESHAETIENLEVCTEILRIIGADIL